MIVSRLGGLRWRTPAKQLDFMRLYGGGLVLVPPAARKDAKMTIWMRLLQPEPQRVRNKRRGQATAKRFRRSVQYLHEDFQLIPKSVKTQSKYERKLTGQLRTLFSQTSYFPCHPRSQRPACCAFDYCPSLLSTRSTCSPDFGYLKHWRVIPRGEREKIPAEQGYVLFDTS